jgi:methylthioribose-1-phosphate isomerase
MDMSRSMNFETVELDDNDDALVIIDQTLLPNDVIYLRLKTVSEVWNAIRELQVRGAPAIGIAAAYGLYLGIKHSQAKSFADFYTEFSEVKKKLASSRPTAVNLFWALDRMDTCATRNRNLPVEEIKQLLLLEAQEIKAEDINVCRAIGRYGLSLLKPGMGLLTHCNAGQLATAKYGTATSAMYLGHEQGYNFKVFVDETRPLLQGARLTAFELDRAGIDVTLICDNMAATVMANGWINAIFVGADRVAANGDAANKIGTSGVAILAKFYGIPFYVCAPTSTIDMKCPNGEGIHIEQRPAEEVTEKWYTRPMAPRGIKVFNPAFDVTVNSNITAIITEYGIARTPYIPALEEIFQKKSAGYFENI